MLQSIIISALSLKSSDKPTNRIQTWKYIETFIHQQMAIQICQA
jgi:ubiquinone biosynthesis protein COQ9